MITKKQMIKNIEAHFNYLKERAVEKFIAGTVEHGEDFSQIDYEAEITAEIIDIINYRVMKHAIEFDKILCDTKESRELSQA